MKHAMELMQVRGNRWLTRTEVVYVRVHIRMRRRRTMQKSFILDPILRCRQVHIHDDYTLPAHATSAAAC